MIGKIGYWLAMIGICLFVIRLIVICIGVTDKVLVLGTCVTFIGILLVLVDILNPY